MARREQLDYKEALEYQVHRVQLVLKEQMAFKELQGVVEKMEKPVLMVHQV